MSEIVDTKASAQPTPAENSDPGEDEPDETAPSEENDSREEEDAKLADLKKRVHPFD
ncbi:MAG TPA: hypothetical protein VGQ47_02340 [Candidatus Limnocylindrales bacterium]|jgi:hypothetical protein|nr:hypothetical protein [Candidatus Limnocylindrales bacterium]